MRKQITQAELQSVVDDYGSIDRRMLQIRKRLQMGATVEPGELEARCVGAAEDYSSVVGYSNVGLSIDKRSAAPKVAA